MKYRVERLLGEGGMGAVYSAVNRNTGKRVAIKWMHAEVAEDPDSRQRFLREAQASARVQHPNVVDVYDVLEEGDALFMVMEYLEGESLSDFMNREGTPLHELIGLLVQAMRGVAEGRATSPTPTPTATAAAAPAPLTLASPGLVTATATPATAARRNSPVTPTAAAATRPATWWVDGRAVAVCVPW